MSGIAEICDCGRRHHDEPASVLRAKNPVGFWVIAPDREERKGGGD